MSVKCHVLLITSNETLRSEFRAAQAVLDDESTVLHVANDLRQGLDTARNRQPQLVIMELSRDIAAFVTFVKEIASAAPSTVIAAAFDPRTLAEDASESALMIEALRGGVQDFLRRPLAAADLTQLIDRVAAPRGTLRKIVPGKTVLFLSNKGGVGKSTLATNVACGLAQKYPRKVLLIDASLQQGVCASLLNLQPQSTLMDAIRQQQRLDEVLLRQLVTQHSSGVDLLPAPAHVAEAAEIDDEGITRIVMLARRTYDFVIVDTFPVFDRVVMALLDLGDRAYLVFENVVPTVLGAVRFLELLESLSYSPLQQRIILNRYTVSAGNPPQKDVAERLGRTIDHLIPLDRRVVVAANSGEPFALRASGWTSTGQAIRKLIREVELLGAGDASPG